MSIAKCDIIKPLLTINDAMNQTWIVDSHASLHATPVIFHAIDYGKACWGNNQSCIIDGIGHYGIWFTGMAKNLCYTSQIR